MKESKMKTYRITFEFLPYTEETGYRLADVYLFGHSEEEVRKSFLEIFAVYRKFIIRDYRISRCRLNKTILKSFHSEDIESAYLKQLAKLKEMKEANEAR